MARFTAEPGSSVSRRVTLVDRDVFDRRLAAFEQVLSDLRQAIETPLAEFLNDRGQQAKVERWTQVLVEIALDSANHLIADHGWQTPSTNRQCFTVLAQEGVLDDELADRLAGWAGLRNVLVHLYLTIDHQLLYEILTSELDQMADHARAVGRFALD